MTELSDIVNDLVGKPSKIDFPQKIRNLLDAIKIPDLKEIPNLPIHDLRDVSVQEGKILEKFLKVKTIKDLAKVTYKDLIKYSAKIRENGVSQDKLELLITTARYIVEAVNYEPTEERKIVLAGLDNAGKTAILKIIKKEMGISTIGSMKPTKGASRDELILEDQKMHIIELGGQEEFRKFYIENPNRYFLDTDIIVYLIDMQDDARYTQSLDYLKQILQVLRHLQEPIPGGFIILLNKCDPDFLELPIFREKIEFMKEKIEELFQAFNQSQSQIMYTYEIQTSSIYNTLTMTPSFSKMLKTIFSQGSSVQDQKFQEISDLVNKIMQMILEMDKNLGNELELVKQRLLRLELNYNNLKGIKRQITISESETSSEVASSPINGETSLSEEAFNIAHSVNSINEGFAPAMHPQASSNTTVPSQTSQSAPAPQQSLSSVAKPSPSPPSASSPIQTPPSMPTSNQPPSNAAQVRPAPPNAAASPSSPNTSLHPQTPPNVSSAHSIPAVKSARNALMSELKQIFGIIQQNK